MQSDECLYEYQIKQNTRLYKLQEQMNQLKQKTDLHFQHFLKYKENSELQINELTEFKEEIQLHNEKTIKRINLKISDVNAHSIGVMKHLNIQMLDVKNQHGQTMQIIHKQEQRFDEMLQKL